MLITLYNNQNTSWIQKHTGNQKTPKYLFLLDLIKCYIAILASTEENKNKKKTVELIGSFICY